MTSPRSRPRRKPFVLGGALSFTVLAVVLIMTPVIPRDGRMLIAALLALGWSVNGARWAIRRYGRNAGIGIGVLVAVLGGAAAYAYWRDEPNRETVAQIKGLGAYVILSKGALLTGEVETVFFDKKATDQQVWQFTHLERLDHLGNLYFYSTPITDRTVTNMSRFPHLRFLLIEGAKISDEAIDELQRQLPNCQIHVR